MEFFYTLYARRLDFINDTDNPLFQHKPMFCHSGVVRGSTLYSLKMRKSIYKITLRFFTLKYAKNPRG